MTPQEEEDAKVRRDLKTLANHVDSQLPYGWGFVVLASPFGADGRLNYISNIDRPDVVRMMYEFIEHSKGKFGEHIADQGASAEDEEIARLRQRVAELEGLLKQTLDLLKEMTK